MLSINFMALIFIKRYRTDWKTFLLLITKDDLYIFLHIFFQLFTLFNFYYNLFDLLFWYHNCFAHDSFFVYLLHVLFSIK